MQEQIDRKEHTDQPEAVDRPAGSDHEAQQKRDDTGRHDPAPALFGPRPETEPDARAAGRTIILTSHVMSEIEELADTVVYLLEGRVWFEESVPSLLERTGARLRFDNAKMSGHARVTIIWQRDALDQRSGG